MQHSHMQVPHTLAVANCNMFEIVCRLSYINIELSSFHKSAEDHQGSSLSVSQRQVMLARGVLAVTIKGFVCCCYAQCTVQAAAVDCPCC